MNKDLILREELAWERTRLAIQRTTLSYLRTAMYFAVAGISVKHALAFSFNDLIGWIFIGVSFIVLIIGFITHTRASKKLRESKKHIGNYVLDYLGSTDDE